MARFRCCGNHSTAGHAADCPMKPPEYEVPPARIQTKEEREEQETGCQFDILHFRHIGECKETCGESGGADPRIVQMQDPDDDLVIVLVEIDPNDEHAEEKLRELEKRGFKQLNETELTELMARAEQGEIKLRVEQMTLDALERQTRPKKGEDPYLSSKAVADVLGFSIGWTRELARRGRFEGAVKLLKQWAIPRSAVLLDD